MRNYDVVVIGGGPAGMSAAITGESEGLNTLLMERNPEGFGGQAGESTSIENYFGFPDGITGEELSKRGVAQVRKFGTDFLAPANVVNIQPSDGKILVTTDDGTIIPTRVAILALGVQYRPLNADGVSRLLGQGVKYGSPQIHNSFEGEIVVVGGANSAGQAVGYLCKQPNCRVHMVVRKEALSATMSMYLIKRIQEARNVVIHYNAQVKEARGDTSLESVVLTTPEGEQIIHAKEMLVNIGGIPKTAWLPEGIARSDKGFILTGNDIPSGYQKPDQRPAFFMETSMRGVFAAGDVRYSATQRIPSAVAEGAIAVQNIHRFLSL